jgi:excisionase family DNA binding protein
MASVAPRYGSASQVATYAGLSVKTIRRLVDAGKVRGHKVGRRVLIPFEDLDRLILRFPDRGSPDMATAQQATPTRRSLDEQGRAVPLSDEDLRRRAEEGRRLLAALDDIGDEPEQRETFAALKAALDEGRAR